MTIRIGDALFVKGGSPAVIKDRDPVSGKVILETEPAKVRDAMRHGYLYGLAQENRSALYEILDQVKAQTDNPAERVELISEKVKELEQDPRNGHLTRYLKAEMTHIMNTYNIRPREYSMSETKAR